MSEQEKPVGTEYAGPSGIGRDSTWLTHEDLVEGKDATVTIKRVILYPKVKFQGGRTRLNLLGLEFDGKQRVLGLNATNRKALTKMYGNLAGGWKGKQVVLYVTETEMAGETVKCVRIRNTGARGATAAEQFLAEDEPQATSSEPVNGDPANGDADGDMPAAAFDRLCELFNVKPEERVALIQRHEGDYDAAYQDLQRMQTIAPAAEKPKRGKLAGGELGI